MLTLKINRISSNFSRVQLFIYIIVVKHTRKCVIICVVINTYDTQTFVLNDDAVECRVHATGLICGVKVSYQEQTL